MTSVPLAPLAPGVHEHDWHLASVENEPGGAVREFVCGVCPAVTYR